jgi:hypothetical protein
MVSPSTETGFVYFVSTAGVLATESEMLSEKERQPQGHVRSDPLSPTDGAHAVETNRYFASWPETCKALQAPGLASLDNQEWDEGEAKRLGR